MQTDKIPSLVDETPTWKWLKKLFF